MKHLKQFYLALCVGLLAILSCNDPTLIGSELIEDEQLGIGFTDTLTIKAKTVLRDSVRTYSPFTNLRLQNYIYGDLDDPIFGRTKATVYIQFVLNGGIAPDFMDTTLDSAVMVLPYLTNGSYGNLDNQLFQMQLLETQQDFEFFDEYYSNLQVMTGAEVCPDFSFMPNITDSVEVIVPLNGLLDTLLTVPQIRIPLKEAFADMIFTADTSFFASDSTFHDLVEGIALVPINPTMGVLGIDAFNAGMEFYFHRDTVPELYFFPASFGGIKMVTFERDITGSIVEEFVNGGTERGDSLLFLQGMGGADIEFEIPYLDNLRDVVVNKAEIILPIVQLPEDDPMSFESLPQLVISNINEDNEEVLVSDLALFLGSGAQAVDIGANWGGVIVDDTYRLDITDHFQDVLSGISTNRFKISVIHDISSIQRGDSPGRTIIGGPGHAENPMKLRLSFTKPD